METYLIIIGIILAVWLSTIRFFQPEQGQIAVITYFKNHLMIVGSGIPEIEIPEKIFNVPNKKLTVKIDSQRAWYITIYPYGIAKFNYRLKKFRTIEEIKSSDGKLRWQPLIGKNEKDASGKPKTENSPDTIALGEWNQPKTSLFFREREEIAIPFLTKDGYRGTAWAYLKFLVWEMSAAISVTYQFKVDPEKSTIDIFQRWCRSAEYLTEVYGVSFEELPKSMEFYQEINASNYISGAILEDIEFFNFVLDPESQDLLEEQENIKKAEIKLLTAEKLADVAEKEGEGLKRRQKQIADGESYTITKKGSADNTVKITLDKSLKANETLQYKQKQQIERENDVKEYRAKKQIDLSNNSKLLTKIGSLKRIPEKTYVEMQKLKYAGLGKLTNLSTLILHEDTKPESPGSTIDEMLEANIVSNQIVHPSKAIANEKK